MVDGLLQQCCAGCDAGPRPRELALVTLESVAERIECPSEFARRGTAGRGASLNAAPGVDGFGESGLREVAGGHGPEGLELT